MKKPQTKVLQAEAAVAFTENFPSALSASQVPSTTLDGSPGSNHNYCHDSSYSYAHLRAEQMVQGRDGVSAVSFFN